MRAIRLALYSAAIIILQTVIFPKLTLAGVAPDLVLVSVIVYSVLAPGTSATLFSTALAFVQDVFSGLIYLNTILKTLISSAVGAVKERYAGDEQVLAAGLVAIATPLYVITEAVIYNFIFHKDFNLIYLFLQLTVETAYNLLLFWLLFPLLKGLAHGE